LLPEGVKVTCTKEASKGRSKVYPQLIVSVTILVLSKFKFTIKGIILEEVAVSPMLKVYPTATILLLDSCISILVTTVSPLAVPVSIFGKDEGGH
jgi:hypothetical protein